jgi:hypothetical protein
MQDVQNTSAFATPHPMQQHGKGFNIIGGPPKVKVIIGDEEREIDSFKIVATWLKPKNPEKPTYAFPLSLVVRTLEQNGVFPTSPIQAIRIKANQIYRKCSELIIYDNRPNNPYKILAWWQNGQWLPVDHPLAKRVTG